MPTRRIDNDNESAPGENREPTFQFGKCDEAIAVAPDDLRRFMTTSLRQAETYERDLRGFMKSAATLESLVRQFDTDSTANRIGFAYTGIPSGFRKMLLDKPSVVEPSLSQQIRSFMSDNHGTGSVMRRSAYWMSRGIDSESAKRERVSVKAVTRWVEDKNDAIKAIRGIIDSAKYLIDDGQTSYEGVVLSTVIELGKKVADQLHRVHSALLWTRSFQKRVIEWADQYARNTEDQYHRPETTNTPPPATEEIETIFHATAHADVIVREGFKINTGNAGLGGATDDAISFTSDIGIAYGIVDAIRKAIEIAEGGVSLDDIQGWLLRNGAGRDDVKRAIASYGDPKQGQEGVFDVFRFALSHTRRYDPLFFGTRVASFKGLNPRNVGVLACKVRIKKAVTYLPAMSEYRIRPEDVVDVKRLPDVKRQDRRGRVAMYESAVDVPQSVRDAAKTGLELRRKNGRGGLDTRQAGKQGIGSGVARASDLVNGKVTPETVKRMRSFFARHSAFKKYHDDKTSAAYISWMLWGGDAGEKWVNHSRFDENSMNNGLSKLETLDEETVSQRVKRLATKDPDIKKIQNIVDNVYRKAWAGTPHGSDVKFMAAFTKWMTARILDGLATGKLRAPGVNGRDDVAGLVARLEADNSSAIQFIGYAQPKSFQGRQAIADYFTNQYRDPQLISRLNDFKFTGEDAEKAADEWHEEQAEKADLDNSRKGAAGRTVIEFSDGYKWVSLDRATCKEEGAAAGHCGNTGTPRSGDNILSLRDKDDRVILTFIVNEKFLGESKGRGNAKPSKKYHRYIIKLLESDLVDGITGGGYQPDNNFELKDLPESDRKRIIAKKPMMDMESYARNATDGQLKALPESFWGEIRYTSIDWNHKPALAVLDKDLGADDVAGYATDNSHSKKYVAKVLKHEAYDDYGYTPDTRTVLDEMTLKQEARLERYLRSRLDADQWEEFEDADLSDLLDNDSEVDEKIKTVYSRAHEQAQADELYNVTIESLESSDDDTGAFFQLNKDPYGYWDNKARLVVPLRELIASENFTDAKAAWPEGITGKIRPFIDDNTYDNVYGSIDKATFNEYFEEEIPDVPEPKRPESTDLPDDAEEQLSL